MVHKYIQQQLVTFHRYPLYISIENLPPILRSKVGMGMFMLSLFTKKLHSKCYDFIFYDCLTKELHEFEKGMLIHTENKTYFVQARLIIHRYDTKSFEYICNVQGTASLNGCTKCDLCPGLVYVITSLIKFILF